MFHLPAHFNKTELTQKLNNKVYAAYIRKIKSIISLVSDADREIPTLGSTDDAGNEVTEKSQLEGKRMMPETRFTEFLSLSVDPRVGISRSASETDD